MSFWHRIFRRFWGPIPWMIEIAAILALKALKQGLAGEATVLREGEYKTVPFRELVPGDVIRIKIGNVILADGK
ncbi:P-type ATPase [Marinobacter antarcticus]|uniref:P-type ATPase n=1 Tax=Marinobacter antarcticus TaxID=564117 RepID=UPI0011150100|nr:hypothetical protein [Marinobacter antarcticus]